MDQTRTTTNKPYYSIRLYEITGITWEISQSNLDKFLKKKKKKNSEVKTQDYI